jgi:hypothetical protein
MHNAANVFVDRLAAPLPRLLYHLVDLPVHSFLDQRLQGQGKLRVTTSAINGLNSLLWLSFGC